jgi:hypothetical protein
VIIALFALTECDNRIESIKNNLLSMQKDSIILPLDKMICMHSENAESTTLKRGTIKNKYQYIVYVDSTQCTPCAIDGMYAWNVLMDSLRTRKSQVDFVFIVAPRKEQMEKTILSIKSSGLISDVYVDTSYVFNLSNPRLPQEEKFHYFMISKENKIVMVGDILYNPSMRKLFNKIINLNKQNL